MNKNKISFPVIFGIVFVILAGVYFLYRTSPDRSANRQLSTVNQFDPMASHHGGVSVSNDGPLNSLVGKTLPDIKLLDKGGKSYTNADLKGKKTILFFNEGLMCYPSCWNQIVALSNDPRFNNDKVQALSVEIDPSADWQKAINKMPELAKATTLFDPNATVSRELGMLTVGSSMHKGAFPGHTYLVLDEDGTVKYVFDDPNMGINNDRLAGQIN